jgi:hypothetical protein
MENQRKSHNKNLLLVLLIVFHGLAIGERGRAKITVEDKRVGSETGVQIGPGAAF